eukprot:TRINITY_DN1131_c0_g2_i1.p1 TRINITY_DN1131_c0_g2~~TRINITY_DN1131_c0_g2_i1.p1  ORF type:complete len:655 (+),score=224.17 TRINITY_DN1131_c0_g2_i1:107-2071(+)
MFNKKKKKDVEISRKREFKEFLQTFNDVCAWITKLIGRTIVFQIDNICATLANGVILCKLLQAIDPNKIPSIHEPPSPIHKYKQNIQFFLIGLKELFGNKIDKYLTFALSSLDSIPPPIVNTVFLIQKLAQVAESIGFKSIKATSNPLPSYSPELELEIRKQLFNYQNRPVSKQVAIKNDVEFIFVFTDQKLNLLQPINNNQRSTTNNQQLTNSNQQPTNSNQQPTNSNQQLTNSNQQLTNSNQQLTNSNQQPTNSNQQPTNSNQQLTNSNQQLTNSNQQSIENPLRNTVIIEVNSALILQVVNIQKRWRACVERKKFLMQIRRKQTLQNLLNELLATEISYVSGLKNCIEYYLKPLEVDTTMSQEDIKIIFSDIQMISSFHFSFLPKFEQAVKNFKQLSVIADIFDELVYFLKSYTQYIRQFQTSSDKLVLLMKNVAFANKMISIKQSTNPPLLDLNAYLIMPVQRIPRYVLLIKELIKNASDDTDKVGLSKCLEKMQKFADFLNEQKRTAERVNDYLILTSQIVGLPKNFEEIIITPELHGKFTVTKNTKLQKWRSMTIFVLNVCLIFTNFRSKLLASTTGFQYQYQKYILLSDLIQRPSTTANDLEMVLLSKSKPSFRLVIRFKDQKQITDFTEFVTATTIRKNSIAIARK